MTIPDITANISTGIALENVMDGRCVRHKAMDYWGKIHTYEMRATGDARSVSPIWRICRNIGILAGTSAGGTMQISRRLKSGGAARQRSPLWRVVTRQSLLLVQAPQLRYSSAVCWTSTMERRVCPAVSISGRDAPGIEFERQRN